MSDSENDEVGIETEVVPDRYVAPISEAVERFLRAILAQVPIGDVEELHLFTPLRQGTVETGIAVLAVRGAPVRQAESEPGLELALDAPSVDGTDVADGVEGTDDTDAAPSVATDGIIAEPARPSRHTVYTAHYRHVIKGPDRGRWESDLVAEADAPLITVEMVVRGVQRRAGEDTATVRYDAAQLAKVLRLPMADAPVAG
jgi:hypothetical protein